jgi:hypothetical protein
MQRELAFSEAKPQSQVLQPETGKLDLLLLLLNKSGRVGRRLWRHWLLFVGLHGKNSGSPI